MCICQRSGVSGELGIHDDARTSVRFIAVHAKPGGAVGDACCRSHRERTHTSMTIHKPTASLVYNHTGRSDKGTSLGDTATQPVRSTPQSTSPHSRHHRTTHGVIPWPAHSAIVPQQPSHARASEFTPVKSLALNKQPTDAPRKLHPPARHCAPCNARSSHVPQSHGPTADGIHQSLQLPSHHEATSL